MQGEFEMIKEKVEIRLLVYKIASINKTRAANKGILIETYCQETVPKYLQADQTRLIQILSNLMSNSLKYTFKGKVSLGVK